MSKILARELSDYVISLQNLGMGNPITEATLKTIALDRSSAVAALVALFSSAKDELRQAHFKLAERKDRLASQLDETEKLVLGQLLDRLDKNTTGPVFNQLYIERLETIADTLEDKDVIKAEVMSRPEMMASTESFIVQIKSWDIPPYAKNTLLIKIDAIQRIIQKSTSISGTDIRKEVLEIIGSFTVEFEAMDKMHRSKRESVIAWAGSLFKQGVGILGLVTQTNDVLAITAQAQKLLTKD